MEKHFKYELDNGKVVNVPLKEVDNLKAHLKIDGAVLSSKNMD